MKAIDRTRKKIGEKLKDSRIKKGHNNYEYFAYQNDINKKTVWKAENGLGITLESFLRILHALDETPEDFFKGIK